MLDIAFGLLAISFSIRASTLLFERQDTSGRIIDLVLGTLYGLAAYAVWQVI